MKTRRLMIACMVGLVGSAPAFADYGEGTMWWDLIASRQEASVAQPQGPAFATRSERLMSENPNASIYETIMVWREELASQPTVGVAGPPGPEFDARTGKRISDTSTNPNEGIYDRIMREYPH